MKVREDGRNSISGFTTVKRPSNEETTTLKKIGALERTLVRATA